MPRVPNCEKRMTDSLAPATLSGMSDAGSNPNVQAGRRVLRLLSLHHRHRGELEQARRRISSRYAEAVQRETGANPDADASARAATPATRAGSEWPALDAAASLARDLAPEWQRRILEKLPDAVAEEFLAAVYSFDALPQLEAREIQDIVRHVEKRMLAIALLGADESIHAAVTRNMSNRAAQMLREDMESLLASGELRTSDVAAARDEVSRAVRWARGLDPAERPGGST